MKFGRFGREDGALVMTTIGKYVFFFGQFALMEEKIKTDGNPIDFNHDFLLEIFPV